jgi:hypothetical protein
MKGVQERTSWYLQGIPEHAVAAAPDSQMSHNQNVRNNLASNRIVSLGPAMGN